MGWLAPLAGGVLIGGAATMLMTLLGRVAGISGIVSAVLPPGADSGAGWRPAFLVGLVAAPPLVGLALGASPIGAPIVSVPLMGLAGLLVGVGTGIGRGCTSGHGVCGLARLSPRSLAATVTFMVAAGTTIYGLRHVL